MGPIGKQFLEVVAEALFVDCTTQPQGCSQQGFEGFELEGRAERDLKEM